MPVSSLRMIRFNPESGNLAVTNVSESGYIFQVIFGRLLTIVSPNSLDVLLLISTSGKSLLAAMRFLRTMQYLNVVLFIFNFRNESIAIFNELLDKNDSPNDADVLHIMCCADEFENIRVRPEELDEVDRIKKESSPIKTIAPVEEFSGKCNVLLQAYISKAIVNSFTLISDTNYIASNASRVARALFEMCLRSGRASAALKFIRLAKSIDHRFWWFQSPLVSDKLFRASCQSNFPLMGYFLLNDSDILSTSSRRMYLFS